MACSSNSQLDTHLLGAAEGVLHPPKGVLKHPYIVPGGSFGVHGTASAD